MKYLTNDKLCDSKWDYFLILTDDLSIRDLIDFPYIEGYVLLDYFNSPVKKEFFVISGTQKQKNYLRGLL